MRITGVVLALMLGAIIIVSVLVGSSSTAGEAWVLGNIGVGATAWLNSIVILIIQVPAHKTLWDYHRQKKTGLDPEFDPEVLGIRNADFWIERRGRVGKERAAQRPVTVDEGAKTLEPDLQ